MTFLYDYVFLRLITRPVLFHICVTNMMFIYYHMIVGFLFNFIIINYDLLLILYITTCYYLLFIFPYRFEGWYGVMVHVCPVLLF